MVNVRGPHSESGVLERGGKGGDGRRRGGVGPKEMGGGRGGGRGGDHRETAGELTEEPMPEEPTAVAKIPTKKSGEGGLKAIGSE